MRIPAPALPVTLAALAALASFTTSAQVIDATACQQSCNEQQSACVDACGSQDNPMECEAQCNEQAEDCLSQCG